MPGMFRRFLANDPRLFTAIGIREPKRIRADGSRTGAMLFGPYIHLLRGRYQATVKFDPAVAPKGSVRLEVCADNGLQMLATQTLDAQRLVEQGMNASIAFCCSEAKQRAEVRLLCHSEFVAAVQSVDIYGEFDEPDPYLSWNQEAVAFMHLPKTGGTTLYSLLSRCYPEARTWGPDPRLHLYSATELADYDFFSGHFDYFSTRLIPRNLVHRLSILRDPYSRLISWYRFCQARALIGVTTNDADVELAHKLSPEEFFENEYNLRSPWVNNAYLYFFGAPDSRAEELKTVLVERAGADSRSLTGDCEEEVRIARVLGEAIRRVVTLDGLGITERYDESVALIFAGLRLARPETIVPQKVTDQLIDGELPPVPPVEMTPRLRRALKPLTRYDRIIYDVAKHEFERRLRSRSNDGVAAAAASAAV